MRDRVIVLVGSLALVAASVMALPVGASADSGRRDDVNAQLLASFDGLNHFVHRSINGNSTEPPQQGLCVGAGYVVESVSSVIAVYDTSGHLAKAPVSLNSFYGYPPLLNRATGVFGPQVSDPSCYFDGDSQRWFHVVLTLDVVPTGQFAGRPTGVNHVDIAVSQTSNPLGVWNVHRLYTTGDGTNGTPNHHCAAGPALPWIANPAVCLGDFPHIGADANGVYITTNEYGFLTQTFRAAQVYAFSKHALEADTAAAQPVQIDTLNMVRGQQSGFTVWPAQQPAGRSEGEAGEGTHGGTEYFLSSNAADEVNAAKTRTSHDLVVWALSNTASLGSEHPEIALTDAVVTVGRYSVPPAAQQKAGPTPLAECLDDVTLPTPLGPGCWRLLGIPEPAHNWTEGQSIDTGDTRMQQVTFAGGMVFGALGTAVTAGDTTRAGVEWFAVKPRVTDQGAVRVETVRHGYVSRAGAYLSAPALAVNGDGAGAIAFSLMGPNDYPSAAYVPFDVRSGAGAIRIAAAGVGPDDGYTNYAAAFGRPPRTRWGDYGAAVVDGSHVWMASEYIGQMCTFAQWLTAPFATCGGTRAGSANWGTRITELGIGDAGIR